MTRPPRLARPDLVLRAEGPDRFPDLVLAASGATARFPCDEPPAVPGGALRAVALDAPRLAHLPEARRRQLLRTARVLLVPGGRLAVPVGTRDHEYPRDALQRAAWACGFEAWVRFAAGRAVLTAPAPRPAERPLVSILIPAFKPAAFAEALDSALGQTWPRCEIVVGDDSPGDAIGALVAERRGRVRPGHELRYLRHEPRLGGRANYLRLFAEARGAYVKYLNDDDVLAPTAVARMALVLRDHPAVTLVTSRRRLIDAAGAPLPDEAFNQPLLPHDAVVDGRALATLVLGRMTNLIGEPTTTMFRRADLADNRPHVMSYAGRSARRNGDMSMWTTLMSRGDVAWLTEPLSSFRQHADQVQRGAAFLAEARLAWTELVQDARDTGLLAPRWAERVPDAAPLPDADADPDRLVDRAEAAYAAGEAREAAVLLRTALACDPEHGRARSDLACVDWDAGRAEDAVLGALVALRVGAPAATALANLDDMLRARGRRDEADAVRAAWTPQPAAT